MCPTLKVFLGLLLDERRLQHGVQTLLSREEGGEGGGDAEGVGGVHRKLGHEVEVVRVVGLEVESGHVDAVGEGEGDTPHVARR